MSDVSIEGNLNLVYWVVNKYYNWTNNIGIPQDDVVQEGCIGLIKAVDKYDKNRGEFSTFAVPYIKGYINIYLTKNNSDDLSLNYEYGDEEDDDELEDLLGEEDNSFLNIENTETLDRILSIAKETLKPIEYDVLFYHYCSQYTRKEKLELLNISNRKYEMLVQRAMYKLRRKIAIDGLKPSDFR